MASISMCSWEAATGGWAHPTNRARPDVRRDDFSPVLVFPRIASLVHYYEGVMPHHYRGGNLTVALMWSAATDVSGFVQWEMGMERNQAGFYLDGWAGVHLGTVNVNCNATVREPVYTELLCANAAGVQPGEHFTFYLIRRAENDNLPGEAELWSVELLDTQ
jgi:hypothetical protein